MKKKNINPNKIVQPLKKDLISVGFKELLNETKTIKSIKKHESYIMNETLSLNLVITENDGKNQILNKKIDILINKLTNNS